MKKRFLAVAMAAVMMMGTSMTAMAEVQKLQPGQTGTCLLVDDGSDGYTSETVTLISPEEAIPLAELAAIARVVAEQKGLDIYAFHGKDSRNYVFTVDSDSFDMQDGWTRGGRMVNFGEAGQEVDDWTIFDPEPLTTVEYPVTLANGQASKMYFVVVSRTETIGVRKGHPSMNSNYVIMVPRAAQFVAVGGRACDHTSWEKLTYTKFNYNEGYDFVLKGGTAQQTPQNQSYEWRSDVKGWWVVRPDGSYLVNEWYNDNGKWYYMGADGYMLTSTTTPDGYQVNADGLWVQ